MSQNKPFLLYLLLSDMWRQQQQQSNYYAHHCECLPCPCYHAGYLSAPLALLTESNSGWLYAEMRFLEGSTQRALSKTGDATDEANRQVHGKLCLDASPIIGSRVDAATLV